MNRKKIEQTKMSQNEFCKDGNYRHNANLYCGVYGWHAYPSGYFECANLIANNLLFEDFISEKYTCSSNKDTNVFPMLFLYRHYIELSLKSAIKRISKLLGSECKYKNDTSHDIESLFTQFINSYDSFLKDESIGLKDDTDSKQLLLDFRKQQNIFKHINDMDKGSISVRYPIDHDNNYFFLNDGFLNIKQFFDKMQEIHTLFDQFSNLLDYLEDI